MRYDEFRRRVQAEGWTLRMLRCEAPPTDRLLAMMDEIGLDRYERFVLRLERESK